MTAYKTTSDETVEAEDKAFMLKLRDTTLAAIEEARFAQIVGRLQETTQAKITGRVQDVISIIEKIIEQWREPESTPSFLVILLLVIGIIVAFAEYKTKLWSYKE